MKKEYAFTKQGIQAFQEDRFELMMQLLKQNYELPNIRIEIGNAFVEIPIHADNFDALMQFLFEAEKDQI